MLIYLTGLAGIDEAVYEARDLDGVSWLQKFLYIELPLILTQVRINLVVMIIGTLQTYGQILILLGNAGGPRGVAMVPGLYMFRSAFVELYAGKACAVGLIVFVFILLLTEINNRCEWISRMRNAWAEVFKHAAIWMVLLFAFFPLYVTFAISVKNNKQFNNEPFGPLAVSGILETFDWRPADPDSRDAAEMWDVQNALDAGLQPEDTEWPSVRVNTEQTWHWENWVVAWNTVGTYIFNTIVVAVCAVILALTCSTAAAFFFARYRMPGSTFLWYFFLVLMLMPGVANLVPLFILLRDLGMIHSLLALIIIGTSGAQVVHIYILRNFIEDIPKDMFDAADVDGASPFRQVLNIVLPMSGPVISTLAILSSSLSGMTSCCPSSSCAMTAC